MSNDILPTDIEIPKELPVDEGLITDFKKTGYELGLLPHQFAGLYKWYMTHNINQLKTLDTQRAEDLKIAETELRKKWGGAHSQNMALAKKVFQTFADEKAFQEFDKGFGNNPILVELFAKIGKVLSEDQLSGKPLGLTLTPEEAQAEINKIKGDLNHPYWKEDHQSHKEAVERMTQLNKMLIGG